MIIFIIIFTYILLMSRQIRIYGRLYFECLMHLQLRNWSRAHRQTVTFVELAQIYQYLLWNQRQSKTDVMVLFTLIYCIICRNAIAHCYNWSFQPTPCSFRLCSASSCMVIKAMPPHCLHLNDLSACDSSG